MASNRTLFFHRIAALPVAGFLLAACNSEIYVRDGVTDGDTFYLAERALTDSDPALQSWVSYSLMKSACQLQIGGDNPARASSFDCELGARRHLLDAWYEQRVRNPDIRDTYLDELSAVLEAGFLPEYVADNFGQRHWDLPPDLDKRGYTAWHREHLGRHKPVTRLAGSWNYARNVRAAQTGGSN
jgi:hypothetical protein